MSSPPEQAAVSINDAGFAFLYAPLYHGAMRFAGPARRQLGIKTIMNLLGPLANPAGAQFQLIGVFSEDHLKTVAEAAVRLGVRRGMVVHGLDGQDELSVCAPTRVVAFEVRDEEPRAGDREADEHGKAERRESPGRDEAVTARDTGRESTDDDTSEDRLARAEFDEFVLQPENYGLDLHEPSSLTGGNADENARVALRLLDGENGRGPDGIVDPVLAALHDAVILNTAAALKVYGTVQTMADGVETALQAIEEGRGRRTLERVVAISQTPVYRGERQHAS